MKTIFYSTTFNVIAFPLAMYYFIVTLFKFRNEHLLIKETLNKNDSFFKALMTLDFKGHKWLPSVFYATLPVDEALSEIDVKDIAQRQIINVVLQYVKNENLLSVMLVYTEIQNDQVLFMIKPATTDIFLRNALEFGLSFLIWSIAVISYCIIF